MDENKESKEQTAPMTVEEKFNKIKRYAFNPKKEELCSQEEKVWTQTDELIFQRMKNIVLLYFVGHITQEQAGKKADSLLLLYKHLKQIEERRAQVSRADCEKRIRSGQTVRELIAYEGKSQKEVFQLLFGELLPDVIDEVAAKKIKEGAGYFLLTGERNLSEKERRELEKAYA